MTNKLPRLTSEEISLFCTGITYLLKSGIPLANGLAVIGQDITSVSSRLVPVISAIEKSIGKGHSFTQAVTATKSFPKYFVDMVEIGETAGKIEEVMNSLNDFYEREKQLQQRIHSAILYPLLLFVTMSFVIALLVFKVLPLFTQMFNQLGSDPTIQSTLTMNFSYTLGIIVLILICIIAITIGTLFIITKLSKGKFTLWDFFSSFRLTRDISAKIAASHYANALALILPCGIEFQEASIMAVHLINNRSITAKLIKSNHDIAEGIPFEQIIDKYQIFPGIFSSAVKVAFKTGMMEESMAKLAKMYEEEVDLALNNITSTIEPLLVGVLSIIIGAIMLSIMLPLAGIMSAIG
jgi:type IV pilus assembly protein PilC